MKLDSVEIQTKAMVVSFERSNAPWLALVSVFGAIVKPDLLYIIVGLPMSGLVFYLFYKRAANALNKGK